MPPPLRDRSSLCTWLLVLELFAGQTVLAQQPGLDPYRLPYMENPNVPPAREYSPPHQAVSFDSFPEVELPAEPRGGGLGGLALIFYGPTGGPGVGGFGGFGLPGFSPTGFGSYGGAFTGAAAGAGGAGAAAAAELGTVFRAPFRITASLQGGYDTNTLANRFAKQSSAFVNGQIAGSYDFANARLQLALRVGGGITYYFDRPQQPGPDYNAFLDLFMKYRFTERLSLDVSTKVVYQAEPDLAIDIGINQRVGSYSYNSDRLALTYLWDPRFSTVTTYQFRTLMYESKTVSTFQNRVENTIGNEFRFLLLPTTTVIGEYRLGFISYTDTDTDSLTHYLLLGIERKFSPRLDGSLRSGVEFREFEGSGVLSRGQSFSPYVESKVSYTLAENSSIAWVSRYGIQPPEVPTNPNRTSFRTGLDLTYALTGRITSYLTAFYVHDEYDPNGTRPGFSEDSFDVGLTLRYAISTYIAAQIGYNFIDISSGNPLRGYERNRFYLGLQVTF
jgi:Putative beta-barrel porin 2